MRPLPLLPKKGATNAKTGGTSPPVPGPHWRTGASRLGHGPRYRYHRRRHPNNPDYRPPTTSRAARWHRHAKRFGSRRVRLHLSRSQPLTLSLPSPPLQRSLPEPPKSRSLPRSPNSWSRPCAPRSISRPAPPQMMSLPRAPLIESLALVPTMTSFPPVRGASLYKASRYPGRQKWCC